MSKLSIESADIRALIAKNADKTGQPLHSLFMSWADALERAEQAESELASLKAACAAAEAVTRAACFDLVERELREVGASNVIIMYWERNASETVSIYAPSPRFAPSSRAGRGTLLGALDALKAEP